MANINFDPSYINTVLEFVTDSIGADTMGSSDKLLYVENASGTMHGSTYGIESLLVPDNLSTQFSYTGSEWSLSNPLRPADSSTGTDWTITGGTATGTNHDGGDISIDGGLKNGTGNNGSVHLGANNAENISLFDTAHFVRSSTNITFSTDNDEFGNGRSLYIGTGDTTAAHDSGDISIDVGTPGAGAGDISIGTSQAENIRIGNSTKKIGFFSSTPVAKAPHPATLADVITILQNLGFCN